MSRLTIFLTFFLLAIGAVSAEDTAPTNTPAPWQWQKTPIPLGLVANGLWYESFHLDAALDKAGTRSRYEFKDLSRYSVVVLVNLWVNRIPKGGLDQLREFVHQGGGLVVLGGLSAYANGSYNGTALEEMLPVTLDQSYIDFYITAEHGAKLSKSNQADWPMPFDFSANPLAYYFHTLIPKPGAKVQVNVGNQPAIISGTYGKGRVVACALTVNGDPAPGTTPFWLWKDWPALLGQAVSWAEATRPAGVISPPEIKPLTAAELPTITLKEFLKRDVAISDTATAKAILDLVLSPTPATKPKFALESAIPALLPYATPDWAIRLTNLVYQTNPNLESRKAALTLLGASHAACAIEILNKALDDKKVELEAIDGIGWLGNPAAIPALKTRYEKALNASRLPDGPDRWDPLLFANTSPLTAHLAIALYRLGDPDAVTRLADLYHVIDFHQHILWNASYRSTPARWGAQALDLAWEYIMANDAIPSGQGPAFVKYAATVTDPILVEWLADILEKSAGKLPSADWTSLGHAKSGIIAAMSQAVH